MANESQEQINQRLTQGVAANAASIALLSDMTAIRYKGVKATTADLPATDNLKGDMWYVQANHHCYIWTTNVTPNIWEDAGTGVEGVSPRVVVTEITGGHQIAVYDVEHTTTPQTFNVMDGDDGVSPRIEVENITNGHRVKVYDAQHPTTPMSFDVMNGTITGMDEQPTENSQNAAKSGGIYSFVNSSVATNTAYFKGTLDAATDLGLTKPASTSNIVTKLNQKTFSPAVTNNDYCFVVNSDSSGNTLYMRFKYTGGTTNSWAWEFTLNNSSFTAAQWNAINSGITSALVTKVNGVEAGAQVNDIENVKFNGSNLAISGKTVTIPIIITDTTPSLPTNNTLYFITGS